MLRKHPKWSDVVKYFLSTKSLCRLCLRVILCCQGVKGKKAHPLNFPLLLSCLNCTEHRLNHIEHRLIVVDSSRREYAPTFALRSYFYLLPSVSAARAAEMFLSLFGQGNDKPQVSGSVRPCRHSCRAGYTFGRPPECKLVRWE